MEKPSKIEEKKARAFVKWWKNWNKLGKNTKINEEGNIQARLPNNIRVVFTKKKEIIDIFKKNNHKSHF